MNFLVILFVLLLSALGLGGSTSANQAAAYKNDVSTISASAEEYAANNNGKYPTSDNWDDFSKNYLMTSSNMWEVNYAEPLYDALPKVVGDISYMVGYVCDGNDGAVKSKISNPERNYALFVRLSDTELYCTDNN